MNNSMRPRRLATLVPDHNPLVGLAPRDRGGVKVSGEMQ